MMRLVLLICTLLAGSLVPARAERVIIALSSDKIGISSNFTGADLTIFGVIERDQQAMSRAGDYEVALILRGPARSVVTREKQRVMGIWVNGASRTYVAAPSVFAIATSKPVGELADESVRRDHEIGLAAVQFTERGSKGPEDEAQKLERARFRQAFIDLKRKGGLFSEATGAVKLMAPNVFRGRITLPSNAPIGIYSLEALLLNGGQVIGRQSTSFQIFKTGFEQEVYAASRQYPLLYGIISVVLALGTGWMGSALFRRD